MILLKMIGIILAAAAAVLFVLTLGVPVFLLVCPAVGRLPDKNARKALEKRSSHYDGGQFRNEHDIRTVSGKPYPSSSRRKPETPIRAGTPSFLSASREGEVSFTWLGHSSFLLQVGGINILADPVLSERCSPVGFLGPKRYSERPLSAEELPRIYVLFVSHDHYDHLDHRTILSLRDRVGTFLVPLGIDSVLAGWGVDPKKILALDWWESAGIGGVTFTLTPSQHFTGRDPLRRNATLWGGVYISGGSRRIYYTGDGGYCEVFRNVRERLGAPDLMIAECGQYDPAWAGVHMFPEETMLAGLDCGTSWLIPVHWGTFSICNHAWDDPIRRVTAAAEASGLSLAAPRIGQTAEYSQIIRHTTRWWEEHS